MRDKFLKIVLTEMRERDDLWFLTADFGSPVVDKIMESPRSINVGIAENLMLGAALGLALDGKSVVCYGIAAFISYRACDILRNIFIHNNHPSINLGLNITILAVGVDNTYELSGESHYCYHGATIAQLFGWRVYDLRRDNCQKLENGCNYVTC